MAAGVIIETPPGGTRGSIAVFVEFLLLEPPVIELLADLVPEADPEPDAEAEAEAESESEPEPEPDPEADADADALPLLFSSLFSPEVGLADAEAEADASSVGETDADCANAACQYFLNGRKARASPHTLRLRFLSCYQGARSSGFKHIWPCRDDGCDKEDKC